MVSIMCPHDRQQIVRILTVIQCLLQIPASPDSDSDRAPTPAAQAGAADGNFGIAAPIGDTWERVAFQSRRWPGHTFTFSNTVDPTMEEGPDVEEAKYFCEDCRTNYCKCS